MQTRLISASDIKGTEVKNPLGESIGEITDLMIDWKEGSVDYAVLSFGGFLGFGNKLFAIPLEKFDFNTKDSDGRILLNASKEFLEKAPGMDKDDWPSQTDSNFKDSVYSYYGMKDQFV